MTILHLHLKGEYFDAIKNGSKTEEYRLVSTWSRVMSKSFDEIRLYRGYPKSTDLERVLRRKFKGFTVKQIVHPHFGDAPVSVYAIDVTEAMPAKSSVRSATEGEYFGTTANPYSYKKTGEMEGG